MSEINAIATNNYLLATQQEVSHDNSLSGNGTVDSPLGVVPGYNETVLWSGNLSTTTGAVFTLSEPLDNFETIKIWANDRDSWSQIVYETDPNWAGLDNVWRRTIPLTLNTIAAGSNKIFFRGISLQSPTTTNITSCSAWGWNKPDDGSYSTHDARITKIVGINRKENA